MARQLLLIRGVARLVFALLRDRRVPLAAKLVVAAAVVLGEALRQTRAFPET